MQREITMMRKPMTQKLIIATAVAAVATFSTGALAAHEEAATYSKGILVADNDRHHDRHDNGRDNDNSNRQSDYDSDRGRDRAEERRDDHADKKNDGRYKTTWYDPIGVIDRVHKNPWYDPLGLFN